MKHPKVFWALIILVNCLSLYSWRYSIHDYFFSRYQSFQYHGITFSISRTTLKYVSYPEITQRIRETVNLAEKVQGDWSVPTVTLQMREELTPEHTPREFQNNIVAAVTTSSEQNAIITFRDGDRTDILQIFCHEYSHASLTKLTVTRKLPSGILCEGLACLMDLLANGKRSKDLQCFAMNQPPNNSSSVANWLNQPGMATKDGELMSELGQIPNVLSSIAFFDLYRNDHSGMAIVRLLKWISAQPNYSWENTIEWLDREYPKWRSEHWIFTDAQPGLRVWTFVDRVKGPCIAAIYRDKNRNLADSTLESQDTEDKHTTSAKIKNGILAQQLFMSGIVPTKHEGLFVRCRLAGTNDPWQDVPIRFPEHTENP